MADIPADVRETNEKTEAEILAGGIKAGQYWRASDTGIFWQRSVDGTEYFEVADPTHPTLQEVTDEGATTDNQVTVQSLLMPEDNTSVALGEMKFTDESTISVGNAEGIRLLLGRTATTRMIALEAVSKGQAIYTNSLYAAGKFGVKLASASSYNENWVVGVAANDAIIGGDVEFMRFGAVLGIDTTIYDIDVPLYVGEAGAIVDERPSFPATPIVIGSVIYSDATNGSIGVIVVADNYDYSFDGCPIEKQDTYIVVDGTSVYMDVELEGGGDLPIQLGSAVHILNCTAGDGVGGRARVELTQGTATSPLRNLIQAELNAGVIELHATTTYPTIPFATIAQASIRDHATVSTEGPDAHRLANASKSSDGRGRISYLTERWQIESAKWVTGATPTVTITDLATDLLDLSTIAGIVYQTHRQDFPALQVSTDGVYLANGSNGLGLTNYTKYTNLIELCGYINTSAVRNTNCRGHLVVFGVVNKATSECKLFVNLPNDLYGGSDSSAYYDTAGTKVVTVPVELGYTAFLIAQIPYTLSGGGATVAFINPVGKGETINLLGTPIGVTGGASGGGESYIPTYQEVLDNENTSSTDAVHTDGVSTTTVASDSVTVANGVTSTTTTIGIPEGVQSKVDGATTRGVFGVLTNDSAGFLLNNSAGDVVIGSIDADGNLELGSPTTSESPTENAEAGALNPQHLVCFGTAISEINARRVTSVEGDLSVLANRPDADYEIDFSLLESYPSGITSVDAPVFSSKGVRVDSTDSAVRIDIATLIPSLTTAAFTIEVEAELTAIPVALQTLVELTTATNNRAVSSVGEGGAINWGNISTDPALDVQGGSLQNSVTASSLIVKVVMVYDGTNLSTYFCDATASIVAPVQTLLSGSVDINLGAVFSTGGTDVFDGYFKKIKVWASNISAQEAVAIEKYRTGGHIAYGDSLTAGVGASPVSMAFGAQLARLQNVHSHVSATGGDTSSQILTGFLANTPQSRELTHLFWVGRNNFADTAVVEADIARMVDSLEHSEYVVMSVINRSDGTEDVGSAAYNDIILLNGNLEATYGSKYIDVRSPLVTNPVIDSVDPIYTVDGLHLNNTGYGIVAGTVNDYLTSL